MARQKRLGEMLIEAGLITESQLMGALGRQKKWGGRLGTNLVALGNLKEEDLRRFLARQTGVKELDLSGITVLPHILKLVPKKIAEKNLLIPVAMKDRSTLIVACADPTDLGALDHIGFITGHRIEPTIATYAAIRDAIDRHYPGGTTLGLDESIMLKDDTQPTLIDLDSTLGGHSSNADPELIIFGSQEEKAKLSPQQQGAAAPKRKSSHQFIREPEPGDFTLDFKPDWAQTPSPPPQQARPKPKPQRKSAISAEQKLKVLMRLLIRKGLITEEELRREWASLQAKGKL